MRDILFRGKSKGTGEWIYGDLLRYTDTAQIWTQTDGRKWHYTVAPETVCQYIGVCDRNHRRIFEGDIVRRRVFNGYIVGEVVWLAIGFCGFYLKSGNHYYPMGKDEYARIAKDDEVIGTVFDNLELLEGGAG